MKKWVILFQRPVLFLCMPIAQAGSLWHKIAGITTQWKYFNTLNLSTNESLIGQWPMRAENTGVRPDKNDMWVAQDCDWKPCCNILINDKYWWSITFYINRKKFFIEINVLSHKSPTLVVFETSWWNSFHHWKMYITKLNPNKNYIFMESCNIIKLIPSMSKLGLRICSLSNSLWNKIVICSPMLFLCAVS